MRHNYSSTIRCCCISCDRAYFRFVELEPGRTVPLCAAHAWRFTTHAVLGGPVTNRVPKRVCTFPGCEQTPSPNRARCEQHFSKRYLPGIATPEATLPETCEIDDCKRPAMSRYNREGLVYCKAHWQRASRNNGNPHPEIPLVGPVTRAEFISEQAPIASPGMSPTGHIGQSAPPCRPAAVPSVQTDWIG